MSEVMITVRGESEAHVAPERATVRLSVAWEGPGRAQVVARTLALADPVRDSIRSRERDGEVETWSTRRLAVRSERPWSGDGTRLALVHYASIDFTVTFADLVEVSAWVAEVSPQEGVSIVGTDWTLTAETRARVEQEVAAEAVRTAVTRAGAYAAAFGLTEVTPIEIADAGLITDGGSPGVQAKALRAFAAPPAPSGVELQGEDILVAATVEARFVAD